MILDQKKREKWWGEEEEVGSGGESGDDEDDASDCLLPDPTRRCVQGDKRKTRIETNGKGITRVTDCFL